MIVAQNTLLYWSFAFFAELWFLIFFPRFFWVFTGLILATAFFIAAKFIEIPLSQIPKQFQFFILPFFYSLGICTFIVSLPGRFFEILAIVGGSILFYLLIQALVIFKNSRVVVPQGVKNLLTLGSLLTLFWVLILILGFPLHYKVPFFISLFLLGAITSLLSYFLFWHHHIESSRSLFFSIILGFLTAEVAYTMRFWNITYPFYNLKVTTGIWGIPLISLTVLIVYYFFWGISFHYLEENLETKHIIEYLAMMILILGFILATAKWAIGG